MASCPPTIAVAGGLPATNAARNVTTKVIDRVRGFIRTFLVCCERPGAGWHRVMGRSLASRRLLLVQALPTGDCGLKRGIAGLGAGPPRMWGGRAGRDGARWTAIAAGSWSYLGWGVRPARAAAR
ncbi:hypothetical protein Vau01_096420 [Virgisporangium aurantiacum]|uniref:Uncharacterized protein n=1 Tax=Virgisporangium aurantiacum TaxID=175570 RepID=A0A8J4E5C3_9ACTN|nr:hypothetical protein Vau01_096420 [Virgisporangium aurantiacum]